MINVSVPRDIFDEVYTKFYQRAAPYFMGLLLGMEFVEYKEYLKK
jgi:hypothetical protein